MSFYSNDGNPKGVNEILRNIIKSISDSNEKRYKEMQAVEENKSVLNERNVQEVNASAFECIKTDETITDSYGYKWAKITVTGYQREVDSFFWPANPLTLFMNRYPPTPDEVEEQRKTY